MVPPLPEDRQGPAVRLALAAWEAPQNLLGLLLLGLLSALGAVRGRERLADRLFVEVDGLGVSLGFFVFWTGRETDAFPADPLLKRHEWGHSIQSRRFGPLYLLAVGLPSVSRAAWALLFRRATGRPWTRYYDAWPEDDADRLGGVAELRAARRRGV